MKEMLSTLSFWTMVAVLAIGICALLAERKADCRGCQLRRKIVDKTGLCESCTALKRIMEIAR